MKYNVNIHKVLDLNVEYKDGTIKRSGYFETGEPIGEWITYDNKGAKYKITQRNKK